jgi:hypothetical protein
MNKNPKIKLEKVTKVKIKKQKKVTFNIKKDKQKSKNQIRKVNKSKNMHKRKMKKEKLIVLRRFRRSLRKHLIRIRINNKIKFRFN